MLAPRALLALASVLLLLSIPAAWIRAQIIDTSGWTDTSVRLLENQRVRRAVADTLAERLLSVVNTDKLAREALPASLSGLSGVLSGGAARLLPAAVDTALASPSIQNVWRQANEVAHTELIRLLDGGGKDLSTSGGVVSIDLVRLLDRLAARLHLPGNLADALPPDRRHLVLLRSDQLETAQEAVKGLRDVSVVLPLLAGLFYLAALVLAGPRRRRALLEIGAALIAVALAGLLLRRGAESYVANALTGAESVRPAIREAIAISTSSWRERALWLAGIGAAVAAAGLLLAFRPRAEKT
jgi:hypothetical protein